MFNFKVYTFWRVTPNYYHVKKSEVIILTLWSSHAKTIKHLGWGGSGCSNFKDKNQTPWLTSVFVKRCASYDPAWDVFLKRCERVNPSHLSKQQIASLYAPNTSLSIDVTRNSKYHPTRRTTPLLSDVGMIKPRFTGVSHMNKKPLLKIFHCLLYKRYTKHLFDSWWNHNPPSVPTVWSPPPFHCLLEACICNVELCMSQKKPQMLSNLDCPWTLVFQQGHLCETQSESEHENVWNMCSSCSSIYPFTDCIFGGKCHNVQRKNLFNRMNNYHFCLRLRL